MYCKNINLNIKNELRQIGVILFNFHQNIIKNYFSPKMTKNYNNIILK